MLSPDRDLVPFQQQSPQSKMMSIILDNKLYGLQKKFEIEPTWPMYEICSSGIKQMSAKKAWS